MKMLAILALSLLAASAPAPAEDAEPIFVDLQGRTVSVSQNLGKVTLVNFWATWCGPCITELPEIQKLHEAFSSRGLRVLAPAANGRDEGAAVSRFLAARGATFESWLWVSAKDMKHWGVGPGIPATLLLDSDGKVRHRFQGMVTEAKLRPLIEAMLAEAPPAKP